MTADSDRIQIFRWKKLHPNDHTHIVHALLCFVVIKYRWSPNICICHPQRLALGDPLHWRHNEHDGVSDHQPHDCLLNRLFMRRSRETSELRVADLCAGNSPVTGEFPAQRASNAENVSIWLHHHVISHDHSAFQTLQRQEHHSVPNHRELNCLFNSLFKLITKRASKLRIIGLLWGEFIGSYGEYFYVMTSWYKENRATYSISQEICTRFCCALLCCGYAIVHNEFTWSIYPYSSGLLCWHWGNR